MTRVEKLLEELTNAFGPSGFEEAVRSVMHRELNPLVDHLETDGMGSLIGRLGAAEAGTRIMMAAHMDEVGLMVKFVTADGYVRFQPLGGWLDQALINQPWEIQTNKGRVEGISGIKTPHVMNTESRTQVFKKEQMFIDVGASSLEDATDRLGIRPGDPIAPISKFTKLAGGSLLLGKAWDDRVGLAVMIEVMRKVKLDKSERSLYAVATVQEEIGLRGAHTSSYQVDPSVGINIEAGVAGDYPGISQDEAQEKVGKGPAIFLHDTSMLPNIKLRDQVIAVAGKKNIPLQFNVLSGYGQDGAEIQKTGSGVPVINIAVPTRYLHSHYGVISKDDFDNTVALVTAFVESLDGETVRRIRSFN